MRVCSGRPIRWSVLPLRMLRLPLSPPRLPMTIAPVQLAVPPLVRVRVGSLFESVTSSTGGSTTNSPPFWVKSLEIIVSARRLAVRNTSATDREGKSVRRTKDGVAVDFMVF